MKSFSTTSRQFSLPATQHVLLALWLLTMISIPILRWIGGDEALRWGVMASVLLLVLAVLVMLQRALGTMQTVRVVVPVLLGAWLLEFVGHTTGYPFGDYHYTTALQPQLGGVPLLIPLAWLMLLPSAWAVGQRITGKQRGVRFTVTSAAAFTAWDFFLDPQMVGWGYWTWSMPGGYFGIPWLNFGGWFVGAAVLTLLAKPPRVDNGPLIFVYIATWLLQSVGQALFWQMPGPALVGFLVMGIFVVWAVVQREEPVV